ncbi:hypothetical protein CEXT_679301 [Caerostris extrusa]|uniref:Uncharacterized protein n=1 Tax=Caerostris extrusa TaxID=172846 RepID=A0AAV4NP35_CAEEX|nr:hypothetical protein CEXT_679301 [Caerostris extrusa]
MDANYNEERDLAILQNIWKLEVRGGFLNLSLYLITVWIKFIFLLKQCSLKEKPAAYFSKINRDSLLYYEDLEFANTIPTTNINKVIATLIGAHGLLPWAVV